MFLCSGSGLHEVKWAGHTHCGRAGVISLFVLVCHKLIMVVGQSVRNRQVMDVYDL